MLSRVRIGLCTIKAKLLKLIDEVSNRYIAPYCFITVSITHRFNVCYTLLAVVRNINDKLNKMRELKFRAWDEQQKIMHHDFKWIKSGEEGNDWIVFTSDKQKLTDEPHPLENPYFAQQLKIMQWTGINDIYEGDIVDFGSVGVVKYDEDRFFVDCGSMHTRVSKQHKVVGNIYENEQ